MSNQRASLLAGLRTGGPRSIPNLGYSEGFQGFSLDGHAQIASPISPIGPGQNRYPLLPHGKRSSSLYTAPLSLEHNHAMGLDMLQSPVTAPAGGDNMFAQIQHQQHQAQMMLLQAQMQSRSLHGNAHGAHHQQAPPYMSPEQQAIQLQLEVIKLQALQQQQNALLAQAQAPVSSPIGGYGPFSPRGEEVPDGRYAGPGGRPRLGLNPNAASFQMGNVGTPTTPTATPTQWRQNNAVSGGTPLGVVASPKQHENAASWRRPSAARQHSQESDQSTRSSTPPTVFISSPEETNRALRSRSNSPPSQWAPSRPQTSNMHLSGEDSDDGSVDSASGGRREFVSSPTSTSGGMFFGSPHAAAREEASRRLYEGLGIGRPVPTIASPIARTVSQPVRQPKGPPSGPEELGARNFASRIRSQGLGVLREHSARRQSQNFSVPVEVY